jgi:hypothetical protein
MHRQEFNIKINVLCSPWHTSSASAKKDVQLVYFDYSNHWHSRISATHIYLCYCTAHLIWIEVRTHDNKRKVFYVAQYDVYY